MTGQSSSPSDSKIDDGLTCVVADDAAATDGNTGELPPSWALAVEAPAATDLVGMGATNLATEV